MSFVLGATWHAFPALEWLCRCESSPTEETAYASN